MAVRPGAAASGLREAVSERWRFVRSFAAGPRQVGAVLPTSRRTAATMLDMARVEHARLVVELGAGTGPITREVLPRLRADAELLAFEIDQALAAGLAAELTDPRLRVVADSAANLAAHLGGRRADVILSAVPFTSLPAGVRKEILGAASAALAADGVMVVLQYSPLVERDLRRTFASVERRISLPNVPPAVLYACRQARRTGAASAAPAAP